MTKLVLFANGCSMCYGSGLCENPETKLCYNNNARLLSSWPGVLGRELGFHHVVNFGYPGSSNDRIVRTTIAWILENWLSKSMPVNSLFVVIGWSGSMRREFYINGEWRQLIPYHDYVDAPASLLNRVYREVAWSEHESAIRFATQVITLQEFFQSYNISYLFFDAITSLTRINLDSGNILDMYLPYIKESNYFNFSNEKGDMSTQVCNGLNKTVCGHPNEFAHADWSRQLASFARESKIYPALETMKPINPESFVVEGTGTVEIFDRKIGLPRRSPSNHNFNRLESVNDKKNLKNKEQQKNSFLKRLRKARDRDPFIYE